MLDLGPVFYPAGDGGGVRFIFKWSDSPGHLEACRRFEDALRVTGGEVYHSWCPESSPIVGFLIKLDNTRVDLSWDVDDLYFYVHIWPWGG